MARNYSFPKQNVQYNWPMHPEIILALYQYVHVVELTQANLNTRVRILSQFSTIDVESIICNYS